LGELVAGVINFFLVDLPQGIATFVTNLPTYLATAAEWLRETGLNILNWFLSLPGKAVELITNIITGIGSILGGLLKGLGDIIWRFLKSVWNNLDEGLKEKITIIWNKFSDMFAKIGEIISIAIDKVKGILGSIWSWIDDNVISPVKEGFSKLWNSVKNSASEAWEGIKSFFAPVVNWFKEKFSAAWNAVKNVFSTGGKIFDGIKEGIADFFKTIVNGIIKGINKVIKWPFDKINGMLNKIRDISIFDIKPFEGLWGKDPIGVPQIPQFLKGGMANFTGPAWLDGTKSAPEAVLNASQTKAFLKLADNLDRFEGGFGGNNIVIENISFQVESMSSPEDGERAFDAFVNRFKEIGNQTGLSFNTTRL
jgi:hypothetical protein